MRPAIQTCLCRSLRSNALDWAGFRTRGGLAVVACIRMCSWMCSWVCSWVCPRLRAGETTAAEAGRDQVQ